MLNILSEVFILVYRKPFISEWNTLIQVLVFYFKTMKVPYTYDV